MGLQEDLEDGRPSEKTCKVCSLIESLPESEATALREAVIKVRMDERLARRKKYSSQWLADVLTANDHPISRSTISRHVQGVCGS